jgi:hypothetical protein
MEYIPCSSAPALHCGLLPATRLAGRKILIELNMERLTGPALYLFSLLGIHSPIGVCIQRKFYTQSVYTMGAGALQRDACHRLYLG